MRVSAGMNARLPLRSPLPHNRLNSLYAGLFVVKLNARHWHTHTHAHGPIVPSDLLTSNPGDSAGMGGVKQKSQRMCVCVTGAELFFFFFCHLKHVHSHPSASDCSGHMGGVYEPGTHPAQRRPTYTTSWLCLQQKHLGSAEASRKQTCTSAKAELCFW